MVHKKLKNKKIKIRIAKHLDATEIMHKKSKKIKMKNATKMDANIDITN